MISKQDFIEKWEKSQEGAITSTMAFIEDQLNKSWDGKRVLIQRKAITVNETILVLVIQRMRFLGWDAKIVSDQRDGDYVEVK